MCERGERERCDLRRDELIRNWRKGGGGERGEQGGSEGGRWCESIGNICKNEYHVQHLR